MEGRSRPCPYILPCMLLHLSLAWETGMSAPQFFCIALDKRGHPMTDKHCTLGVDIGTTSAKAVAFAPDGATIAQAEAGIALLSGETGPFGGTGLAADHPASGIAEQDP